MTPEFQRITIIGAKGQMGGFLSSSLRPLGCTLVELDQPLERDVVQKGLCNCDLVLLCIPVTAMEAVLQSIAPLLDKKTVLADIGSVKELPLSIMLRHHAGPVVGTHPLFGPEIPADFEPKIAIVTGREEHAHHAQRVSRLFEQAGFSPFASTAEEHDKAMAFIQGLNFTTTAAYLAAAGRVAGIEHYITPSFNRRLDAAQKMLTSDSELFETISDANPYLQTTTRQFMSLFGLAAGGDLDLLVALAQRWWPESTAQSAATDFSKE